MTTLEIILFVFIFLWLINISTSKRGIEIDYDMLAEEVKDRMRFDNTTYDYDEFQPEDEDSKKIKK